MTGVGLVTWAEGAASGAAEWEQCSHENERNLLQ